MNTRNSAAIPPKPASLVRALRIAATGRGGVIVLREILNRLSISGDITIALQGWGNVGSYFALIAETEHPDWKLVAATDSSGGMYSKNGLSAAELDDFKKGGNKLAEFNTGETISNEELIGLDVDVLVLAALEDAVNQENVKDIKAKIVLELGNGPVGYEAYKNLSSKDIAVVPDILANSGGVIVSYLEWYQNKNNERWTEDKVNRELEKYLVAATDKVYARTQKDGLTLKEAAFAEAISKLTS
jgi:glutamate dehydrogenase (NADP+)